jgi:hypothetical protein
LKPAQANSSGDPISKNTHHKKGLVEWLKVKALSANLSTAKKKKKTNFHQTDGCSQNFTTNHSNFVYNL